ncbi:MAG: helix-turn-helix domain-containing protein [Candidatus Obscuribacterales bacterium]|nr:helix-turn-helix domain-containing protein [Candidatus Obscuribacterales bacterium]
MSEHEKLVYAVSLVLRDRREVLSISQSDLARKSGLHRSYIGDLERGFRNLSLKNLSRLSAALDMVPSKLLVLAEKKMATGAVVKSPKVKASVGKKSAAKSKTVVKKTATKKITKIVKAAKVAKSPVKKTIAKAVAKKSVKV